LNGLGAGLSLKTLVGSATADVSASGVADMERGPESGVCDDFPLPSMAASGGYVHGSLDPIGVASEAALYKPRKLLSRKQDDAHNKKTPGI
jgi:hypothetical protein